jgi:hypothetical protein
MHVVAWIQLLHSMIAALLWEIQRPNAGRVNKISSSLAQPNHNRCLTIPFTLTVPNPQSFQSPEPAELRTLRAAKFLKRQRKRGGPQCMRFCCATFTFAEGKVRTMTEFPLPFPHTLTDLCIYRPARCNSDLATLMQMDGGRGDGGGGEEKGKKATSERTEGFKEKFHAAYSKCGHS